MTPDNTRNPTDNTSRRRRKRKPPAQKTHHTRQRHPRPPDVPSTARATIGDAFGRGRSAIPTTGSRASLSGSTAQQLAALPAAGLLDTVLEVVGAENLSLRQALTVWQHEQDRALNRAWRRPGGLARPAGL